MYVIDIKKKVFKFIQTLDSSDAILAKLKQLEHFKSNQRLSLDIERMKDTKSRQKLFRLRIGEIRIIFEVLSDKQIIYIKAADYRGNVYS